MKKKKQNDEAPLPAREAALRILERTGISAPVQSLLDTKLTGGLFSRQEAALTTELVYGYLRSEIRISWLLSQFMKAPEKLPASMKLMIGIAAYELLYLDRIPPWTPCEPGSGKGCPASPTAYSGPLSASPNPKI